MISPVHFAFSQFNKPSLGPPTLACSYLVVTWYSPFGEAEQA